MIIQISLLIPSVKAVDVFSDNPEFLLIKLKYHPKVQITLRIDMNDVSKGIMIKTDFEMYNKTFGDYFIEIIVNDLKISN